MTAIAVSVERQGRLKIWRLATFGVAWLALAWAILDVRMLLIFNLPLTSDANDYWMAWHGPLYDATVSLTLAHFNYSPVAALAFWPLSQLPHAAFLVLWTALGTAAYVWLLAPLPLASRLPALAAGFLFSLNGNIDWLLALVAVLGLRWPSLWLIALFTKVAPFIGFAWFAIRGEWRSVAQSAVLAALVTGISAVLLPSAWPTWIGMLGTLGREAAATPMYNSLMPPIPLILRQAGANVLVWVAARRDRPVLLVFVLVLCQPDWHPWALGILAAVPRLYSPPVSVEREVLEPSALARRPSGLSGFRAWRPAHLSLEREGPWAVAHIDREPGAPAG